MLKGIDVHATYQAGLNAGSLGVDFVITKATGGTGFVVDGWPGMLEGVPLTGIYHYAREVGYAGSAQAEATHFISEARKGPADALLFLDWEEMAATSLGDTAWILEWMRTVEAVLGRRPILYTGDNALNYHDFSPVIASGYKLWYAHYPYVKPVGWQSWGKPDVEGFPATQVALWQYSAAGGIPGWSGPLDLNIFYGDTPDWTALATPVQGVNLADAERDTVIATGASFLGDLAYLNGFERTTAAQLRARGAGDCSDWSFASYDAAGHDIGGMSSDQATAGTEIASWSGPKSQAIDAFNDVIGQVRKADLIVMAIDDTRPGAWSHVEMALEDGMPDGISRGHGGPGYGPTDHNIGINSLLGNATAWTIRRIIPDRYITPEEIPLEDNMKIIRNDDKTVGVIAPDGTAISLTSMNAVKGLQKVLDAKPGGGVVGVTNAEYAGILDTSTRLNNARNGAS